MASNFVSPTSIPPGLKPYFQEYDLNDLEIRRDANLIIQRTLDFGTWDEIRWLFEVYGVKRIRLFLREHGERSLKPASFNYWRKLLRLRRWQKGPFPTLKGEVWTH
ncbi:MAG: hypothetical protein Fur0022_30230 [Anaerolineales bacterium]